MGQRELRPERLTSGVIRNHHNLGKTNGQMADEKNGYGNKPLFVLGVSSTCSSAALRCR